MVEFRGYRVLGEVAAGSTGTVYRAHHEALDRDVAIKVLDPALAEDQAFRDRFRDEARVLAALDDPHIVTLFDFVEDEAGAWLVEEWVDGATLAAVLAHHGALTAEQSVGVVRGALLGLATAHRSGVVHGDVSAGNILVTAAGESTLVDFGLAGPVGRSGVIGTAAFMSPEAQAGEPLTTRSDVFSAAAVLHLLLTGVAPVPGAEPSADLGPRIRDALGRGLSADPAARQVDAAELLADLEDAARETYGAGWLSRASVAGLATGALTGAVAATTAAPTSVGSAAGVGAAQSSAITSAAVGATAAAATRSGRGRYVAVGAAVAAVIAVVAVLLVTRGGSSPQAAAVSTDAPAGATASPSASVSASAAAPAFSGTYALRATVTSNSNPASFFNGNGDAPGTTTSRTWTVTPSCPAGYCPVTVASSSGATYRMTYQAGRWSGTSASKAKCVDDAGKPTGQTIPVTAAFTLTPDGEQAPAASLAGGSTVVYGDCGSGKATVRLSWVLTRTGS